MKITGKEGVAMRKKGWLIIGVVAALLAGGVGLRAADTSEQQMAASRAAAEKGDAEAQYKLGERYLTGTGVKRDPQEALKWYQKAAEQGYAPAQFRLSGRLLAKGDQQEAVKWLRKAAEQEYANAQYALGLCYVYGWGVKKDPQEAATWYKKAVAGFRKAAEQGDAEAQFSLGTCYETGDGVEKDLKEAVKWYRKAAEQGYSGAQQALRVLERAK